MHVRRILRIASHLPPILFPPARAPHGQFQSLRPALYHFPELLRHRSLEDMEIEVHEHQSLEPRGVGIGRERPARRDHARESCRENGRAEVRKPLVHLRGA